MKKKLKDLTIAEIFAICDNTEFNECLFGECKISRLCGILGLEHTPNISAEDKEYLESEADV